MRSAMFPSEACGQCRIYRNVERENHNCDPAEPNGHGILIGKGARNPVQADDEMPNGKPIAAQQRALKVRRCVDEVHHQRQTKQGDRPEVERRKAGRRRKAGKERERFGETQHGVRAKARGL